MRFQQRLCGLGLFFAALVLSTLAAAEPEVASSTQADQRQYTYAWLFAEGDDMAPRGGTTKGPAISLDSAPSKAWQALQQEGLSKRARDRLAILAMVGDYRTSFDFIETVGLTPGYTPGKPYQSWGTERVYLLADEPDFISLQHILVMVIELPDGTLSEPMVVKHWRQDWRYEDRYTHQFVGRRSWQRQRLSRGEARGRWTQAVYQVDDSPRYEAIGEWVHAGDHSFWESDDMRRPLPRREFSVRNDYHALYGSHRITITPTGWVQEEDALKMVLDDNNQPDADTPHLAREAGLSRYQRVVDYDFSAGDIYWEKTSAFWAGVRDYWDEVFADQSGFTLKEQVDGLPMFMALFEMAEAGAQSAEEQQRSLRATLDAFFE